MYKFIEWAPASTLPALQSANELHIDLYEATLVPAPVKLHL
jgi:hypothetical protein